MIRLMLKNYNKKEVALLAQIIRDGIVYTRQHCDEVMMDCSVCRYKWLCEDLAYADCYLANYTNGRSDTHKRYKKSR